MSPKTLRVVILSTALIALSLLAASCDDDGPSSDSPTDTPAAAASPGAGTATSENSSRGGPDVSIPTPIDTPTHVPHPGVDVHGTPGTPGPYAHSHTVVPAGPTGAPDKSQCDELRASTMLSPQERQWLLENCPAPTPRPPIQ